MNTSFKNTVLKCYDMLSYPFSFLYLPVLKFIKKHGVQNFPLNKSAFLKFGIFPLRDHYYEPQFVFSKNFDAKKIRNLQLDIDAVTQLKDLNDLRFKAELNLLPKKKTGNLHSFYYENLSFEEGDADLYYLLIRNLKPKKIIEIGSGFSTLIALEAARKNKEEGHITELICIEPYEYAWLEEITGITVLRKKVEELSPDFFKQLNENDFLFIDSSHIIRPENDVLFEYLEVLPILNKGVYIHVHDIFTPRHYPYDWLVNECRLWNEQYLVEAFLYYNTSFKILFSLNHLKNSYFNELTESFSNITPTSEPASFWLRKIQ